MEKKFLEISWISLWRVLFMAIFAAALYFLRDVLTALFMALVISSAIDAPISFLESKKIPRILGAIIIFLAGISLLSLLLYAVIPTAVVELKNLFERLSELKIPAAGFFGKPQFIENWKESLENYSSSLLSDNVSFLVEAAARIFGGLVLTVAVFALSFYLSISKNGVENFLRAVIPAESEDYAVKIYFSVKKKLGRWFRGQLVLSLIVGLLIFFGLWLLGVKYSLILGILGGVLEIVPFVGPVFVGALAFLAAVSESFASGIFVIVFFVIVQQLENHLFVPAVMKKAVGLHPVVAVVALMAGVQLAGFVGIILAVPTAVIVQEIIESRAAMKKQIGRFNFE